MKKINKHTILFVLTALLLVGCNKDFLETSPTYFLSEEDLAKTAELDGSINEATLRGIYTLMVAENAGRTGRHEDFGHKSFDILSDMLSSDMALIQGAYNRYTGFANLLETVDYTAWPNYMAWRYYYRIIRSSNLVIKSLGGNDAVPTNDESKWAMGQAKALRAYAYFYLSQFFVSEYNPSADALPIYTDPEQSAQPLSKLSDVYSLIIDDLTQSIDNLDGFERTSLNSINKDVARGLLAYVYASIGDSASNIKAKDLADDVINSVNYTIMSADEVTGGFTTVNTPGWMWGFDITLANDLNLLSWWGMMDYFHYSYQAAGNYKGMDDGLYAQIKDTDVRKQQFDPNYLLMPVNKFYNEARTPFSKRFIEDDYVFMRVSEMYLLSAEMAAKEGMPDATTMLKEVLKERFEDPTEYSYVDALSGQDLVDEIILQTRIEMWGEGKSYFLMKRNKSTTTRGTNHVFLSGQSFQYNDERLTFSIPIEEIQNNPNIN